MSFDRFYDLRFCKSRFFHNNHLKLIILIQLSNGRLLGELTPTHPVLSENVKVKTLPFGRCKLTDIENGFKAVGKCEEVMHYYGEFLKTKKEVPTEK
jgi:hypothetical protein